ncbi:MAG: hypothetical protein FWD66_06285 [Paludibacter sp.]|nr:hypothetical protein [Paludibacter sp.]
MNIKTFLFLRYFNKKKHKTSSNFVNFDKIKKILLLADTVCLDNNELNKIVGRYEQEGKQIKTLIYSDKINFPKEISQNFWNKAIFSKRDTNFFSRPKAHILNDIAAHDFDLLIDLNATPSLPTMYTVATANATCKIGLQELEISIYDIVIDVNLLETKRENSNLITVFEKIDFYLKKIK